MNKVGIYLRLSNEDKIKNQENSESIKNQRNMLIDYINNNKDFILIDEYCDEDLSGAGTYRKEFERLINDCKNKKINTVLCKSQSRFSRDIEIVEKYINNKFNEWNIRFISLTDNIDTLYNNNKKTRQINSLINEWFLEDVSNNIRSAFNIKMKKGEFISPFAPYGYKVYKNKLLIDLEASLIVKQIYNMYLKGYRYTKIINYLNNNNIYPPSLYKYKNNIKLNILTNKPIKDIKWNTNTIKRILTNEVYIGNLIQGKRTTISYKNHKIINKNKNEWIKVYNTHEPIIKKETFYKVQSIINMKTKSINKSKEIHIFSKIVYCNKCKHIMKKKNSSKHSYLVCTICKKSIRYDYLELNILNLINNKLSLYYDKKYIANKIYINNNHIIKEKQYLINKKNNIKKYIKNLYEDRINRIINNYIFKELLNNYNEEINNINKKIINMNNKLNIDIGIINKYNYLKNLNPTITHEFIDKILIDKQIYIKWNI